MIPFLAAALWLAAAASAAPIEALQGETSPLKIVLMAPASAGDRTRAFEEVNSARNRYLREGLLLRVDEETLEARGAADIPKDGLVLVLATGSKPGDAARALDELLGPKAGWKSRFPFPAARSAVLAPRDRPAARAYLAIEDDFRLMDRALAGVWKQRAELFPGAPETVDVIVQDTADFYIYSLKESYPYAKAGRRGRYQVYRLPHDERPPEHEMWGCAAGPPRLFPVLERRVISERAIRCSPWGSFRRQQEKTNSIYRFEEGYLATLIHEFGHAYEQMLERAPTDDMREIRRRVRALKAPAHVDLGRAEAEAFAQWCELRGARALYPEQYRRLMKEAGLDRKDTEFGHAAGLRAAAEMLKARDRNSTN